MLIFFMTQIVANDMLAELYSYLTTPCSFETRQKGYLRESVAIEARYRRCHHVWSAHLEQTRRAIIVSAEQCKPCRKAVVLGSGSLLDIPVETLAARFDEVCLIDLIHPKVARRRIRSLPNVYLAEADLGGIEVLPFPESDGATLIVSANLLSQLPLSPVAALRRRDAPEDECLALGQVIIETHLARLRATGAHLCLITDITRQRLDHAGNIVMQEDALFDVTLPAIHSEWDWDIAPAPEKEKHHSWRHRVAWVILA